ncbi:MAG: hypothetical protein WB689_16650 [Xanthobacteraceae bacterium]
MTIADRSTTRQQFSIFAEYKHSRLRVADATTIANRIERDAPR